MTTFHRISCHWSSRAGPAPTRSLRSSPAWTHAGSHTCSEQREKTPDKVVQLWKHTGQVHKLENNPEQTFAHIGDISIQVVGQHICFLVVGIVASVFFESWKIWTPSTKYQVLLSTAEIPPSGHDSDLQIHELIQSAADKLFLVLSSLYTPVKAEATAECQNKDGGTLDKSVWVVTTTRFCHSPLRQRIWWSHTSLPAFRFGGCTNSFQKALKTQYDSDKQQAPLSCREHVQCHSLEQVVWFF